MSKDTEKNKGISRRGFLRAGAFVLGGLGLSGLLSRRSARAAPGIDKGSETGYGSRAAHGEAFSMVGTVDSARNGFDTNFDKENEVYALNSVGFEYQRRMIPIKVGEKVRVYLINLTEFDPINSFHLHAEFFDYYDHGTTLEPTHRRIDTIMQCQAQRGFLEFSFRWPGKYMFHAHQSEFAEPGWMARFNVVEEKDLPAALAAVGLDPRWDRQATQGSTVSRGRGIR